MVRSSPDVAVGKRPERNNRQPVTPDGSIRMFRQEVVQHPEESTGKQKTNGVVPIPPLHDRVLCSSEQRIGLAYRYWNRQAVHDVEHRDHDDQCAIEPI